MARYIIFFRDSKGVGRIKIDGKVHGSDFKDFKDAKEWLSTMKDAGLYTDRFLVED